MLGACPQLSWRPSELSLVDKKIPRVQPRETRKFLNPIMASTRNFKAGDHVEVDVDGGIGLPSLWVPAVVTRDTDPVYGLTHAITCSKHPGISRSPGWNPEEIRPLSKEQG